MVGKKKNSDINRRCPESAIKDSDAYTDAQSLRNKQGKFEVLIHEAGII